MEKVRSAYLSASLLGGKFEVAKAGEQTRFERFKMYKQFKLFLPPDDVILQ